MLHSLILFSCIPIFNVKDLYIFSCIFYILRSPHFSRNYRKYICANKLLEKHAEISTYTVNTWVSERVTVKKYTSRKGFNQFKLWHNDVSCIAVYSRNYSRQEFSAGLETSNIPDTRNLVKISASGSSRERNRTESVLIERPYMPTGFRCGGSGMEIPIRSVPRIQLIYDSWFSY